MIWGYKNFRHHHGHNSGGQCPILGNVMESESIVTVSDDRTTTFIFQWGFLDIALLLDVSILRSQPKAKHDSSLEDLRLLAFHSFFLCSRYAHSETRFGMPVSHTFAFGSSGLTTEILPPMLSLI